MKLIFKFLLMGLLAWGSNLNGQGRNRSYERPIQEIIESLIQPQFGSEYRVGVLVVDSVVNTSTCFDCDEIADPYGTLRGCVLFAACKLEGVEDSSLFGVYKSGSILWMTPAMIEGIQLGYYKTGDINRDGQVDILTTWYKQGDVRVTNMWIFSWDGSTGRIINGVDEFNKTVLDYAEHFELLDANGDGISEIQGSWGPDDNGDYTLVLYGWDGSKYAVNASLPQNTGRVFFPANKLHARLKLKDPVRKTAGLYVYEYVLINASESQQKIQEFHLRRIEPGCTFIKPEWWLAGKIHAYPPLVTWSSLGISSELVRPGQMRDGFGVQCDGLPSIVRYYLQGDRPSPTTNQQEPEITLDEYVNDAINNSVTGMTIGPVRPPSPFVHLSFVDSIISFARQSADLGWLGKDPKGVGRDEDCDEDESPEDGIARNTEKRLLKARREIERRDSVKARAELEKLIRKIDRIWERAREDEKKRERRKPDDVHPARMTSEAYALLKYNSEFLVERLPWKEERGRPGKERR